MMDGDLEAECEQHDSEWRLASLLVGARTGCSRKKVWESGSCCVRRVVLLFGGLLVLPFFCHVVMLSCYGIMLPGVLLSLSNILKNVSSIQLLLIQQYGQVVSLSVGFYLLPQRKYCAGWILYNLCIYRAIQSRVESRYHHAGIPAR